MGYFATNMGKSNSKPISVALFCVLVVVASTLSGVCSSSISRSGYLSRTWSLRRFRVDGQPFKEFIVSAFQWGDTFSIMK